MKKGRIALIKSVLFVIIVVFAIGLKSQTTNALSISSPGSGLGGLSGGLNNNVDEVVSDCNPAEPGQEASVPCQAETMNPNSYYQIWADPVGNSSPTITVKVTYTCLTGYEGFNINGAAGSGTTIVSGPTSFSGNCNGEAEGANQDYAGKGYTHTVTIQVKAPSPCNQVNYGSTECEAILEIQASNPAQGPGSGEYCDNVNRTYNCPGLDGGYYFGGSVEVNMNVSFNANPTDIYQANSTEANGSKPILCSSSCNSSNALANNGGWDDNCGTNANPQPCSRQFGLIEGTSGGTQSFSFEVPCTNDGSKAYLAWEGVAWALMNGGAHWTLKDDTTGNIFIGPVSNGAMTPEPNANGQTPSQWYAQSGVVTDMNTVYVTPFTPTPGHVYTWKWTFGSSSVSDNITYSVPFAMNPVSSNGGSAFSCSTGGNHWTLTGHSTTSKTVTTDSVTYDNEVINNGPNAASYNWWVQGCYYTQSQGQSHCTGSNATLLNTYCGVNGTSSGGTSPCPLPTGGTASNPIYCPAQSGGNPCPAYGNKALVQYTFPNNANTGDGYCIRIGYSNATGNNTPQAFSSPACTSFQAPAQQSATCTSFTFNSGQFKSSQTTPPMFYAVYAYNSTSSSNYPDNQYNDGTPTSYTPGQAMESPPWHPYGTTINAYPDVTTGSLTNPSNGSNPTVEQYLGKSDSVLKLYQNNYNITYNMSPSQYESGTVNWLALTFNVWKDSSGNYWLRIDNVATQTATNCFPALGCSINVTPEAQLNNQANDVLANSAFNYTVTFTTGPTQSNPLIINSSRYYVSASVQYNGATDTVGVGTIGNSSLYTTGTYSFTASSDITQPYAMTVSQSYPGTNISYSGLCPVNVSSYSYFSYNVNATATLLPTQEAPTSVQSTYVYNENPPTEQPNNLSTDGILTYSTFGGPQLVLQNYGSVGPNTTKNYSPLPSVNAGDQYCATITLSPSNGYVGPGGNYIGPNQPVSSTSCDSVHNEPYAQFFGNDVMGDSAFGNTCGGPNDSNGIYTFSHATTSSGAKPVGSYSQFGAQALGIIEGLASAGLRTSTPTSTMGLSFSNTKNTPGAFPVDASYLGGNFGTSQCASTNNFFNDELSSPAPQTLGSTITASDIANSGDYNAGTGAGSTTTIGSGGILTIPTKDRVAIFVKGNVYIDSNIDYQGAGDDGTPATGWGTGTAGDNSVADIPSLWIIASGNIYIAPSVTNIDGVYIAQPDSSTVNPTGIIDTCAQTNSLYPVGYLYGDAYACDNQLTINGTFIDQYTVLDRSFSSLRYGTPSESPQNGNTHVCGNAGLDINGGNYTTSQKFPDCAAEVFNFSPELYLAQPPLIPAGGPLSGKYDFITGLSPVL